MSPLRGGLNECQNQPLYIAAEPASEALKLHFLVHSSLDIVEENEKMVALFQNEREIVGVVQVAGTLARRIRNLLEVGDQSAKGGIYGRIKFGSQVVVIVPGGRTVSVKVGDRVIDGETILAK